MGKHWVMNLRDLLKILLVSIIIGFVVTDCTTGKTRYCPGRILYHHFYPPYTTLECEKTKEGQKCHPVNHPARYCVVIAMTKPDHTDELEVGLFEFARLQNNQSVLVGERIGRWSKLIRMQWIQKTTPTDY